MQISNSTTSVATEPNQRRTDRAKQVAREFESMFVNMMIRSMRKTVGENPLFPAGFGEQVYTDMLDDEYSKMLGRNASLGLADLVLREIERSEDPEKALAQLTDSKQSSWATHTQLLRSSGASAPTPPIQGSLRERIGAWNDLIEEACSKHQVDRSLVAAVIAQESGGNPYATSRAGAKGLMQLMDTTARDLGVADSYAPRSNVLGGVKYLRMMLDRFNNDEQLALASYNAGPSAVERHKGIPPYKETQDYVKSVLQLRERFSKGFPKVQ